jgi:Cu/Ag efflux protein CusF
MNIFNKKTVSAVFATLLVIVSASAVASDHGMHHEGMQNEGMHGEGMHGEGMHGEGKHGEGKHGERMSNMREVMGIGRLNKIMAERGMVNINHEPMPEMDWPKMRMNFQVQEGIDLSELNLGDEVEFTLLVDGDNNYVISNIKTK